LVHCSCCCRGCEAPKESRRHCHCHGCRGGRHHCCCGDPWGHPRVHCPCCPCLTPCPQELGVQACTQVQQHNSTAQHSTASATCTNFVRLCAEIFLTLGDLGGPSNGTEGLCAGVEGVSCSWVPREGFSLPQLFLSLPLLSVLNNPNHTSHAVSCRLTCRAPCRALQQTCCVHQARHVGHGAAPHLPPPCAAPPYGRLASWVPVSFAVTCGIRAR
jgi:hypothetical protein